MAHELFKVDNKNQSIAMIVTFSDEAGRIYAVMGRGDPRYRDVKGKCLSGKLPLGRFQFIGGRVEMDCAHEQEQWFSAYPELGQSLAESLQNDGYGKNFDHLIALNGLKELGEEMGLTFEKLHGFINHPTLHWIHSNIDRAQRYGGPQDVHYLHLNLGTLNAEQIDHVKAAIQPGDDTIQSIVIPVDKLKRVKNGELRLRLADGEWKVNDKFDGFPEWEEWKERYQAGISSAEALIKETRTQITAAHVASIAFPTNLPEIIKNAERQIANIQKVREIYQKIHETIRGLDGIDTDSLYTDQSIGLYVTESKTHLSDSAIFNRMIERNGQKIPQEATLFLDM